MAKRKGRGKVTSKGKPEIYSLAERPADEDLIGLRSIRPRPVKRRGLVRRVFGLTVGVVKLPVTLTRRLVRRRSAADR